MTILECPVFYSGPVTGRFCSVLHAISAAVPHKRSNVTYLQSKSASFSFIRPCFATRMKTKQLKRGRQINKGIITADLITMNAGSCGSHRQVTHPLGIQGLSRRHKKSKIGVWAVCVITLYNELFRSVGATFLKAMTLRGEIVGLIPTVPLPTDLHVTASRYLETNASVGNPS